MYWRLILKILAFAMVVICAQVLWSRKFPPEPIQHAHEMPARLPDDAVWMVGDSTLLDLDSNGTSVPRRLGAICPSLTIVSYANAGSDLRLSTAAVLNRLRHSGKPKAVIIEVNLRSLSDAWIKSPNYVYGPRVAALRMADTPLEPFYQPLAVFKAFPVPSPIEFESIPVYIRGKFVGDMNDVVPTKRGKHTERAGWVRAAFMSDISPQSENIAALVFTVRSLKQRSVPCVVYSTPIDITTCTKLAGPGVVDALKARFAIVHGALAAEHVSIDDLTFALPTSAFEEGRLIIYEHLKRDGREMLSQLLATRLQFIQAHS